MVDIIIEQNKEKYCELSKYALVKKINEISKKDKFNTETTKRWIVTQTLFDDLDIIDEYYTILT
jgi:hypothetical protein